MFGLWNYSLMETVLNMIMKYMICIRNEYYINFLITKSQNKSSGKCSFFKEITICYEIQIGLVWM
jgi:hypothetical protein